MRLLSSSLLAGALAWACGQAEVVLPETLGIVAFEPSHGAVGIGTAVAPVVVLSHPLAADVDLDQYFGLRRAANQQELVLTLTLSPDGYAVSMVPQTALDAGTVYEITVGTDLPAEDPDVRPLPTALVASFTTAP